jgi:hypothetical protein
MDPLTHPPFRIGNNSTRLVASANNARETDKYSLHEIITVIRITVKPLRGQGNEVGIAQHHALMSGMYHRGIIGSQEFKECGQRTVP